MAKKYKFYCFITLTLFTLSSIFASEPQSVYLTWQKDPTSTMTVTWIGDKDQKSEDVYYQKEGENTWTISQGTSVALPQGEPYLIHKVELDNLLPKTAYIFKVGDFGSKSFKFKTMPKNSNEEIRFVVGGDLYKDGIEYLIETHKQAAAQNPQFALVGGDIAYTAGKSLNQPEEGDRWLTFMSAWKEHMVTKDGFLIPIIPSIGNHDVLGRYNQDREKAKFFYSLFAFPGKQGYNVLDFGSFLSIFVLDTNHTNPIGREQTNWLKNAMDKRKSVKHKFALYHVPAYPCVKNFKDEESVAIRKNWVPIFENYAIKAAFENHDHAYKRTFPILRGEKNKNGVLYLGDGAWGIKNPRKPKKMWFLEKSESKRHFILVTINGNNIQYQAIDHKGNIFDKFSQ